MSEARLLLLLLDSILHRQAEEPEELDGEDELCEDCPLRQLCANSLAFSTPTPTTYEA